MMKAGKKKTITIETLQRTVIRHNTNPVQKFWCEFCQAEVEMIVPESAAKIMKVSMREIYRRIERGEFHFFETDTGKVFICPNIFMTKQRGVTE